MPAPLDLLYALRAYDQASPQWSPSYGYFTGTGTAANPIISASVTPPENKALFVTNVFLQAVPQAAVSVGNLEFAIVDSGGIRQTLLLTHRTQEARQAGEGVSVSQITDGVIIGGRTWLQARFQFSAGNVANVIVWGYHGYEVPRGNVAL